MNILITGGAGFVGANLARTLQERDPDAELLIIDDMRTGTFANLAVEGQNGWSYQGHLIARPLGELDLEALASEFDPDVIFHQASITDTTVQDERQMLADNVEPFVDLLNVAQNSGARLVWASSAATYGTHANGATPQRRPFQLDDAGRPANVYGFSKWIMENLHRRAQKANPDLHVVGLRYFNVFGPGESHKGKMASMVYQLAHQMLQNRPPRIFHDGQQARDQVYIKDVVDATIAAAAQPAQPGIYNVGSGQPTSFNQIIEYLNHALQTNLQPDYFQNPYHFYQDYTCADLTQTQHALNWTPAYTPQQAIHEYATFLQNT